MEEQQTTQSTLGTKKKIMTKQLTGKRGDTLLHSAARSGNLAEVIKIYSTKADKDLDELLLTKNQSGETALYAASEYGCVNVVKELVKYYDAESASVVATNGYDAFHVAANQGELELLKILHNAFPQLSMTVNLSNTTALHTAAARGHNEVVNFLLEVDGELVKIAKNNGKTALHSAARNGHLEIVKAILARQPGLFTYTDKKGQTALHMAAKGHNTELVEVLINLEPSTINIVDTKGNTALHIAARKGRAQIAKKLLSHIKVNTKAINRSGETTLDTAEKFAQTQVVAILRECGIESVKAMKPPPAGATRELKKTVSDIKHNVHYQLEHTWETRKRVQEISKQLHKMQAEGLNNAINSTTVVAVLIATVAFAAIFTVPGQFAEQSENISPDFSIGEANIAPTIGFMIFFLFDSVALFISLAVVVVQTSVVAIESEAKKQMMAVINKLMWLACVLISVAYLALAYVVVGKHNMWLAIGTTVIGTVIMATTLGIMCYWVIKNRIEVSNQRNIRKSSGSRSQSWSISIAPSDAAADIKDFKSIYAI